MYGNVYLVYLCMQNATRYVRIMQQRVKGKVCTAEEPGYFVQRHNGQYVRRYCYYCCSAYYGPLVLA